MAEKVGTFKQSDRNKVIPFEMWCWKELISWQEYCTDLAILEELCMKQELMARVAYLKFHYLGYKYLAQDKFV